MKFNFIGTIPASKSLMNRALIVQSLFPAIEIIGESKCDDVVNMQKCLQVLWSDKSEKVYDCGHGGTVLRFLAPRVSREKAVFKLTGSKRLMNRPQQPLLSLLGQLGAICSLDEDVITVRSDGWHFMGDAIHLTNVDSSQFASGFLLSCWMLDREVYVSLPKGLKSRGYLDMTIGFLRSIGMIIDSNETELHIPKNQKPAVQKITVEPDYSSLFAVAICAALFGEARFTSLPESSLQPDSNFLEVFREMNIPVSINQQALTVSQSDHLKPIELNVSNTPDLVPVLSVLCAMASGTSKLFGASHLVHKESNRIEKTYELITKAGGQVTKLEDGLIIEGNTKLTNSNFEFDPDEDHRMAMAAGILKKAGCPITILNPSVVNKSFPEFFDVIGVDP